jgi:hypothetical protein
MSVLSKDVNSSDSLRSLESSPPSINDNRPVTPQNEDVTTGVNTTPFIKRIASVRLPDEASELRVPELAKLWKLDLAPERVDTFLDCEFNLVTTVFKPPFTVDNSLLSKMTSFSPVTGWKILPVEWTEAATSSFLNSLVDDIRRATGQTPRRSWVSQYCNQILPGSPIKRKPDIVLLDINHEEPVTWRNIRAITEVTRSRTEIDRMVDTINDKTFIMFTTQFNRTFVPMISIFDNNFRLTVTDRQGQLRSIVYKLSGPHSNHAIHLIHLLATLCFGSPGTIGYDASVITNSKDETTAIICNDVTYKVLHCVYAVQSLVGRATHVFLVELNNQQYILKDSWIEKSRPYSESVHLKRIKGVQGVPVLHQFWDVKISDSTFLSTWLIRLGNFGIFERSRIRRRIVSSSIGVPISQFRTKKELISAFRDITQSAYCALHQSVTTDFDCIAHFELCYTYNTVHRDISYNNIMLFKDEDATTKLRRGLLIDFDYAARINHKGKVSPGHRTASTSLSIHYHDYSQLLFREPLLSWHWISYRVTMKRRGFCMSLGLIWSPSFMS